MSNFYKIVNERAGRKWDKEFPDGFKSKTNIISSEEWKRWIVIYFETINEMIHETEEEGLELTVAYFKNMRKEQFDLIDDDEKELVKNLIT